MTMTGTKHSTTTVIDYTGPTLIIFKSKHAVDEYIADRWGRFVEPETRLIKAKRWLASLIYHFPPVAWAITTERESRRQDLAKAFSKVMAGMDGEASPAKPGGSGFNES